MLSVTLSEDQYKYWLNNTEYHCMYDNLKFLEYFLKFINNNLELKEKDGKIKIYGIQDADASFNKQSLNTFLSVENCNYWNHYSHHKKYGDFSNNMIDIYLYNHIDNFIKDENYIAIPVIYTRIEYFKEYYQDIKPSFFTPFSQKKFCLQVSRHSFRGKYSAIQREITTNTVNILSKIGEVEHIEIYKDVIGNSSCYHSEKLLNLFNEYKFILCFENSFTNGYITEKIFNAFFSRTIPIYIGPKDTNRFINKKSYINGYDLNNKKFYDILTLTHDETSYNDFINQSKINDFDNQNYIEIANKFIQEKLK